MTEAAEESVLASAIAEPKLWAGKYKTPEELEAALIGKDKEYGKLYSEHGDIKKKYEEFANVPEDYSIPSDVALRESEINEIRTIARNAGLNQVQFEKTAREMQARIQSNLEVIEQRKKDIGESNLVLLKEYVDKYYPENLRDAVLNQIIRDKNAMSDALKDRESRLNSAVPGMDRAGGSGGAAPFDGQRELEKAHNEYHKRPTEANRKRYIDIATQVGEERYKDKVGRR